MRTFPVFLDIARTPPLVIGGGALATAKVRTLLTRAPHVTVAAPALSDELRRHLACGRITWLQRTPTDTDLAARPLIVSATEDDAEDARHADRARRANIPVNVPDKPELCTFAFGALVDRGDLSIAIGTDGAAPVLATHLRAWLERELHPRLGRLTALARSYRDRVAQHLPAGAARRRFWQTFFTGAPATAILADDEPHAHALIDSALKTDAGRPEPGRIHLVGAGPGDPELLTLKALRAIKSADVILYDRLVGAAVLDHARREVELIDVGKRPGQHAMPQAAISQLLVDHARAGKTVVRLKGGDVGIFGRAVEELSTAQAAGIPVDIIPGITAAQAGSAALQLPLTARGHVRQFSLVTGASRDGQTPLDARSLAQLGQAGAIYMGVNAAPDIQHQLLAAGLSRDTPIVIVENASRPNQRAISTKLRHLPQAIRQDAIKGPITGPALIYVGLDWSAVGLKRPEWVEHFTPKTLPFPQPNHHPPAPTPPPADLPLAV